MLLHRLANMPVSEELSLESVYEENFDVYIDATLLSNKTVLQNRHLCQATSDTSG
jgi:hypothetical protein